jgi:hypothetical protein
VPEILSGNDLADYFSPENLDFRGLNKTEYLRTNKLPEGYYKFTVEVLDYNRSNLVSNRAVANAYITLNDPPIINRPSNNTKINITDPTNIIFNWTPRHMGSPNSAFSTEYHFKMVEIWPQGRNPYEAMRTSPVLYEATVTTTSLVYDMMCPQLIPGKEYAFTITAADVNGRDLFKNGGESETYRFIYGDECKPPTAITARAVTGNGIEVSWTPGLSSTGFNINYRVKGTDRWYDQNTLQANTRVYELPPSTEIEYKVNAECGSTESSFSTIQTIKTKDAGEAKAFVCGNPNTKNDISNRNDVTSLMPGAVIDAGGFEARITSVTRNDNGSFTGECIVTMPYFNYAKVPHTFSKIRVNVLNQMYEGRLLSKKNPDSPFVKTIKKQNAEDEKLANAIQTSAGEITADKTVKIDATIISITVDPATGDYIVKKEDGSTEVVKAEESKKTLITDKNGDQYLAGGGTVNKVSGAGIENNTAQASTVDDIAGAVDKLSALEFSASSNATAGFDKFKNDALKDAYNEETILGNSYRIPWKAVEVGGVDYVEVAIPEKSNNFNPASVSFTKESGATVASTQSASGKKQLLITGGTADETEGLEAKYLLKDKEGKEQSELIGKINIASYNKKLVNLRIVPVNGDKTSTVDIQNKLNKIYGQAVTNINVQTLGGITVSDLENAESFEDAGTGLLSHYTGDMKKVIKAFKNSGATVDDEAYYLFLIPTKPTGTRTGFMPLKSQFGFIFTGNGVTDLAQTMAHELGHGAFRLYHTFSSNNKYTLSASTTDNLMDYRNGTELDKYQWDYVQNPQGGLYLFQGEEEGAMKCWGIFDDCEDVLAILSKIKSAASDDKTQMIIKPQKDNDTREFIGNKLDINRKEFKKLRIIYTPDKSSEIKFDPNKFTELNDLLVTGTINGKFYQEYHSGFEFLSDKKTVFEILIEDEGDSTVSMMKCLKEYLFGSIWDEKKVIVQINRVKHNSNRSVGKINVDNGALTGYTLELPKGTDSECQSSCTAEKKSENKCNRIIKGTYKFDITTSSSLSFAINKSLRLSDVPGRSGILMHKGVNARIWSEGCILAMRNDPTNDADNASATNRANNIDDSEDFCIELVNYIKQRESEIKSKFKLDKVEKIIIITEDNETQD